MSQPFEIGGRDKNPLHQVEDDAYTATSAVMGGGVERYNILRAQGYQKVIAGLIIASVVTGITWRMTQ